MTFLLIKLLHLVAVVLFLGNINTGVFWVHHLARRREPALLAEAMRGVIVSDRWITLPFVTLVIAAGVGAAVQAQLGLLRTPWILWGIVAISLSGLLFVPLVRLQRRIVRVAGAANPDWAIDCAPLLRRWDLIGGLSLLLAWMALVLMVLKLPA